MSMLDNIKIAFVIVGWNNIKILEECIKSIESQTYKQVSIYYVDNDSSDGSASFVTSNFPTVKVIRQNVNTGFARGNNIGIRAALTDESVSYVALLNTDARIEKTWAKTIIDFAINKPKGAAFQTITLDYFDSKVIDSTHIYVARNGQGTQGSWRRPILFNSDVAPKKVFGCNAAAIVFSRKFIEQQPVKNLFEEHLFMYLEDVDVAARATIMGWDNYIVPGSRAYHMGSISSGKNPDFSLYMTFRNNLAVLFINFPAVILIRMVPKIIRADISTIKTLRKRGQNSSVIAVVKGRVVGFIRLPIFILARLRVRKLSKISYKSLWQLMLNGH